MATHLGDRKTPSLSEAQAERYSWNVRSGDTKIGRCTGWIIAPDVAPANVNTAAKVQVLRFGS